MERPLRGPAFVLAVLLLGGAALDLLGRRGSGGLLVAALRVRERNPKSHLAVGEISVAFGRISPPTSPFFPPSEILDNVIGGVKVPE